MKILKDVDLKKYTTVKIGGVAKEFIIPETVEELMNVIRKGSSKYVIGGGSNLLISERVFDRVLCLREFDKRIENQGNGCFEIGASVRLQRLINAINEAGYGGIEYLFSVPGLVGGAVVMNAGRGKNYAKTISDYIEKVKVLRQGKLIDLQKEQCEFEHRNSIFKNSEDIIVSVTFRFPEQDKDTSSRLKAERLILCQEKQDQLGYNFGSVFMEANPRILRFFQKHNHSKKEHVYFSSKTLNWIINDGTGTFKEAEQQIQRVKRIHKLFWKRCILEVIMWK